MNNQVLELLAELKYEFELFSENYDQCINNMKQLSDYRSNQRVAFKVINDNLQTTLQDCSKKEEDARATTNNRKNAERLLSLGVTQKRNGQYAEALASYNEALRHYPNEGCIYYSRAKLLYILKSYDKAVQSYLDYYLLCSSAINRELDKLRQKKAPQVAIEACEDELTSFMQDLCVHLGHALYDKDNSPAYAKIYLAGIDPYRRTEHLEGILSSDVEKVNEYERFISQQVLLYLKAKSWWMN